MSMEAKKSDISGKIISITVGLGIIFTTVKYGRDIIHNAKGLYNDIRERRNSKNMIILKIK